MRARRKLECCASSPETAKRQRACAVLASEAAADTSHHGRAPKERGLSLAQCSFHGHDRLQPARHGTRAKLECCASSPETASAGASAPRDKRRWLGVGGCSWHVAPRARAEGERPLASAMSFNGHEPTTTSATRREYAASTSAMPPPGSGATTVKRPTGPFQPRGHDGPPDVDSTLPRCANIQ